MLNAETLVDTASAQLIEILKSSIPAILLAASSTANGQNTVTDATGANHHDAAEAIAAQQPKMEFVPLQLETRFAVGTAAAAYYCNRKPQTLRAWACHENGPILPVRLHGRLAWPVGEIRRLLGCDVPSSNTKRTAKA